MKQCSFKEVESYSPKPANRSSVVVGMSVILCKLQVRGSRQILEQIVINLLFPCMHDFAIHSNKYVIQWLILSGNKYPKQKKKQNQQKIRTAKLLLDDYDDDGLDEWATEVSILHYFCWEVEQDVNLYRHKWLPVYQSICWSHLFS